MTPRAVREALLARREIALLDLREEDPYAQAHPLWAANLPLSRIELDAWGRIPRRDTTVVVFGDDAAAEALGVRRLVALGYTDVHVLEGGLAGWQAAGYEVFRDVNVPSKAFGEWVEAHRHTPSLPAPEVRALLDAKADVVVLDVRRFDEYQTMSIPGAVSVPGGELVLRARELAPDPATRIIVNCAGRTRSIIGTQSLVNAGLPNPVAALRNGTIGWTLAGLSLDHGAGRRFGPDVSPAARRAALEGAQAVAGRAGVQWLDAEGLRAWRTDPARTTYCFDVRTPEEYAAGHRRGFRGAPGGQLVQETDVHAPVRGARIVIADDAGAGDDPDAGVRAAMTASWLAQMGWTVAVLRPEPVPASDRETGPDAPPRPPPPAVATVTPAELSRQLAEPDPPQVIDVGPSARYVRGHIPGAAWSLRSDLRSTAPRVVVTCPDGALAAYAAADLAAAGAAVRVLTGGTAAWSAAGHPLEAGEQLLLSPRIDRYRRPYEGTNVPASAMQAYLDWEFGLVAQLERDATHHFAVVD